MSGTLPAYVAAQLRAEMGRRELSNIQLGAMLGVSDMWVSRRARGKTEITMADIERIANALGLPLSYFLPESERVA